MSEEISYEDFAKLDIRIGTILSVEKIPDTDKLLKCTVDLGEAPEGLGVRTIVSGIAEWKTAEELVGRQCPYIANLAPRMLRGVESQGMLLAAGLTPTEAMPRGIALLHPECEVPPGTRLK